ncbi:ER degradation-enhancing alpha-mannosidase-like 3 [Papilio machaon]|uniref:alpha-1,2-Mannosidase n=1 Tax=Papilio machaon TaxID=76193 RepID=A0A194QWF5_PAPMA|nr:ER degradation-enhancing alpha-mannosidase-like 3 [Papilio machaon]
MQRHTFIPEAFTSDLQVHWGQHPLRPEFLESTYFLHRATGDDHYLHVGKSVLRALQRHTRVPCGYAAVNDVRTRVHEDRMDSFVLAETFKYLYMLFGEDRDLPVHLEDYVLTTEAHFLPLALATDGLNSTLALNIDDQDEDKYVKTCPSTWSLEASSVRRPLRTLLGGAGRPPARPRPLTDPRQLLALADMGISVLTLPDGRVQLLYTVATAKSSKEASEGMTFMREMSKWNTLSDTENGVVAAGVATSERVLAAGPAHFGRQVTGGERLRGVPLLAEPPEACSALANAPALAGMFGVARRGRCTFAQKARNLQAAGARLAIVLDNIDGTSYGSTALFAMSGDGIDDIQIPTVFLFSQEADHLLDQMKSDPEMVVSVGELESLKRLESCSEGACEALLQPAGAPPHAPPHAHTFDHLKSVLSQLVAQFELSLAGEEAGEEAAEPCADGDSSDLYVTKTKFVNDESRAEALHNNCSGEGSCAGTTEDSQGDEGAQGQGEGDDEGF